ncbi:MAG: TonB-dependent receptor [Betaproteobacteria bacterium HGW-Betaproteobacteria-10]|nr:MAG: TonB-dependent receptor [Betaproteobacteria bacterium HGW-Betaproteobacteria-10]
MVPKLAPSRIVSPTRGNWPWPHPATLKIFEINPVNISSTQRKQLGLALALLWAAGNVFAADEDMFFSELPIVASVSRLPQRLADAPTSVTVIDREMIRSLPIRDLNDIFRLVPGFQTYPNTTEAGRVTYHGLTDEEFSPRLQVLLDGRSMYSSAFSNGVNWAIIPVAIEDIERIEIVRGTNAVSYGSNAFLGVINIITVDPSLVRGTSVTTHYGSQNVRDYGIRSGGKLGESGNFRFTYRQQNDDGLVDNGDWIDSYTSRLFDLRADFTLTDRDSLQVSAGQVSAVTQRGRLKLNGDIWLSNPTNPIRDFDQSNAYAQVLWRRIFSAGSEFSLRYAYSADDGEEGFINPGKPTNTPPLAPFNYDKWGASGTRHEIEAQHILRLFESARLSWGGSWRHDAVSAVTTLVNQGEVKRDVGRLFGNLEWKPAEWFTGNFGLAAEHDSMAGSNLSPRISAAYHFNPENTVRVGASRAHRTGSVIDYRGDWYNGTKYQFSGNPNMPSERMDTLELAYLGDWRKWRMSLDVRVFQEKVFDRLLVIDQSIAPGGIGDTIPDAMTAIQDVRMQGVEYQWRWQPFDVTRLVVNQAFIDSRAEFTEAALANKVNSLYELDVNQAFAKRAAIDELSERGAPRRATSLLIFQKLPLGFEFTAAGYWQDKMKWSVNTWADKYRRFDARLGYRFRWGGQRGEIAYVAQSLNGAHGEYKAYPNDAASRVVDHRQWLSLRLDF